MPEDHSICASKLPPTCPSLLHDADCIRALRRVVRAHPLMCWARARSLGDDLEQLALMEVPNILRGYQPGHGTTPEQYVGSALRVRLFSCKRTLVRIYGATTTTQYVEFRDATSEADLEEDVGFASDSDSDGDGGVDAAFTGYAVAERTRLLTACIPRLPNRQRQIIDLALQDNTEREIAQQLGISVQSVNKGKQSALKALRVMLAATIH
jgi:RNA polymerase sigma factor (sigma-70 family)